MGLDAFLFDDAAMRDFIVNGYCVLKGDLPHLAKFREKAVAAVPAPPEEFGYGVSLYANAWPLVEKPLRDFQIGLASIWIVPIAVRQEAPR